MIKVFVSQPMRGRSDEEILREREAAKALVRGLSEDDVGVIDSFFQGAPADVRPLWFLGESLKRLSGADVAYFAPGWESARGCRIEMQCAKEYGIPVIVGEED